MDGLHDTSLDRILVVQSLSHRSQAVGCARSCADDLVVLGQSLVVHVEDDGLQIVACRSRDNDLLSTSLDVSHALILRSIETCALENDVDVESAPRKVSCILLLVDSDLLAIYLDVTSSFLTILSERSIVERNCMDGLLTDDALITTVSGIILQELSQHLRAGQVVDSNNLITGSCEHLTESQTADTAETIDSYFYVCHFTLLFIKVYKMYFRKNFSSFFGCKDTIYFLILQIV